MFVRDMQNACMEEIIELYRADDDKKENFKVNEAVKLLGQGDRIIVRTYDNAKFQRYIPVNEHTRSVVEHIMDNLDLCLCEVVNYRKDTITILVKQYPVSREMDAAVLVKDEFIRTKLAKQKQFRNIHRPYDELKEDAVYSPDDKSEYFVVGRQEKVTTIRKSLLLLPGVIISRCVKDMKMVRIITKRRNFAEELRRISIVLFL